MPREGENMSDTLKWAIIAMILGGTSAGQYLGFTKPEQQQSAQLQAAAEFLGAELEQCYVRLNACQDKLATCQ